MRWLPCQVQYHASNLSWLVKCKSKILALLFWMVGRFTPSFGWAREVYGVCAFCVCTVCVYMMWSCCWAAVSWWVYLVKYILVGSPCLGYFTPIDLK